MKEGPITRATDGAAKKTKVEADQLSDELSSKLKLSDPSPSTVPTIPPSTTTATPTPTTTSPPTPSARKPLVILCDFAYGLPKEARPRKEKLLAIAKQMVNFLSWQAEAQQHQNQHPHGLQIVGCPDEATETALTERMHQLWKKASPETSFPAHLTFTDKPLEAFAFQDPTNPPVYLSPDADEALDPAQPPPSTVVVGLLIDRRIQVNRSRDRATTLTLPAARLPLDSVPHVDRNEPLNVDCILEGMQQWYWNCQAASGAKVTEDCFQRAALQALQHHETRHPERPRHKSSSTAETIIFLDIDGVLLPFEGRRFASTCGSLFPDHTLEAFSLILQEMDGVKIVLSSTWRVQDRFRKEIIAGLRSYGYAYGGPLLEAEFMDLTDPDMHSERQHEIYDWLQRNQDKVGAWVALDDEELMEGAENAARRAVFQGHVVRTESHIGLTVKNARYAIGLLQAQLSTP
jgi:hypothetical protein